MRCEKEHHSSDFFVKSLIINQGSYGRHKCASCAYEEGLKNGKQKIINFNIQQFISDLPESQKGARRHRCPVEAYTLGFFHGLNGSNNHVVIKEKFKIATQMRKFGMAMVARGVVNATFSEQSTPYAHAMGVVHIANGFEILIKSRIVEEHPLLILSDIPKETKTKDGNLQFEHFLDHGRTIQYSDLPERLWAATGCKIRDLKLFENFGNTRNKIVHLSVPEADLSELALNFTFKVIEQTVADWWDETILEYVQDYDEESPMYILEQLDRLKIKTEYKWTDQGLEKIAR